MIEAYYNNQASNSMLQFSGHYRQICSGFGALAAGIGLVALPMPRHIKSWKQEIIPTDEPIVRLIIAMSVCATAKLQFNEPWHSQQMATVFH